MYTSGSLQESQYLSSRSFEQSDAEKIFLANVILPMTSLALAPSESPPRCSQLTSPLPAVSDEISTPSIQSCSPVTSNASEQQIPSIFIDGLGVRMEGLSILPRLLQRPTPASTPTRKHPGRRTRLQCIHAGVLLFGLHGG